MTGMKWDIEARLDRIEARPVEGDQALVVSEGGVTSHTCAEARTGLGRSMTLASLEDEVILISAQQLEAGHRQQRAAIAGLGLGMRAQTPQEATYRDRTQLSQLST